MGNNHNDYPAHSRGNFLTREWTTSAAIAMAASLLCGTALADQPAVVFDGWTVNNGVIDTSASCTGTVSCSTLAEDDGFIQQQVSTPHGTFTRTIITDAGATGDASTLGFADESFIPMDNPTGIDIDFKQNIRDAQNGFDSVTQFSRNSFVDAQGNFINIAEMNISQAINGNDGFANDFALYQNTTDVNNGATTYFGKKVDIDQQIPLGDAANPFAAEEMFAYRERWGFAGSFDEATQTLQMAPLTTPGQMTLNNTVSWDEGERIATTWIAYKDRNRDQSGFNYQSVKNLDQLTGSEIIAMSLPSDEIIDPFDWDVANFGPAPSLP